MNGKTALLAILVGLALAAATIQISVWVSGTPLPIMSKLPDFHLIDQDGAPFSLKDLTETATLVDFVFTRCMGPCPMMALEMGKLQTKFADSPNIRFLSISVDPTNDSPKTLTEYGASIGAIPGKWNFATGDGDSIVALSEKGFKLPASTWPAEHSTRFVLVDKKGQIRGYYESTDPEWMKTLVKDIGRLLRSKEG